MLSIVCNAQLGLDVTVLLSSSGLLKEGTCSLIHSSYKGTGLWVKLDKM